MKVAIIGGGASGLVAGATASKNGHKVDIFEANEKVGKKLYITGKGRCNVTNYSEPKDILENVVTNSKFLYSSLYAFTSFELIELFESLGVPIKIERGNRAFPESDKSSDIIKALERYNKHCGTNILLSHKVLDIKKENEKFLINTICGMYNNYDCVIICVGGKTYSATGSVGDGYNFAKKFGHTVSPIKPGLVPIILNDKDIKEMEGLSLKNVKLIAKSNNKVIKELFGEMLFTSNGISGPIALSMSSYINKYNDIELLLDLKPALSRDQLIARINRDIENLKDSQVSTLILGLLPKSLAYVFINRTGFIPTRKNKTLTTLDIDNIVSNIKEFKLSYKSLDKLDFGIITSGGVNVKEIDPKTMQSKIVPGLYFAGEVIDVDALTGGYNLQIAFSTGFVAGNSIK